MPQRIDVIVDGRTVNTNQRSDSDAIWKRIRRLSQTARVVEIRRHTAAAPKPSPPPVVTPPSSADPLELARNVCFFATVDDGAITYFNRLPPSWKAAFTADPAYPVTDQQIAAVKASGHRVYSWCDCRPTPDGTPPRAAIDMARDRSLDGWYGQAETANEFDRAFTASAPAVVGNLSALTPDQLAVVAAGGPPLFINETYYNVQPWMKPDWRGANKGVGGNCWAFYASASEGAVHTPLDERFNAATDSIYAEGMLEADWKALLEVAR